MIFNAERSHLEMKKDFFFTYSKLYSSYYMGMSITKCSTSPSSSSNVDIKKYNISPKQVLEPRKAARRLPSCELYVNIYTNIHKK